jgi:hypothetical protein
MSTQVQFRRGTTTQNNAFTGAAGEITYDTDVKTLRIHDGTTAGGGAIALTTTATQNVLNKTLSTGSIWNGGIIGLLYGGTGRAITTPIPGGIMYGVNNGAILAAAGTSGQVLISGGDSAPSWVASTSLQAGNSVNATYATNIAGGSAGQLLIQQDSALTTFIAAGDAGTFLKSNGAGYAPGWTNGQVTYGSTTVAFGATSTSIAGLTAIDATSGATSFFLTPTTPTLFGNAVATTIGATTGTLTLRSPAILGAATTQNLFNTVATTVNAFGASTNTSVGASTGTHTINNAALVHNSTGATTIATGTTAQRPTGALGKIRYNSDISSYEGYASGNWSSLGGVKAVNAFTYIIAETSAAAANGDLDFYAQNAGVTAAVQVGQWNRTNLKDYTGTIVGTQTTQNIFNATATTINLGGAATTLSIGAATGTTTVNTTTLAAKAITASTTLGVTGNATVGGTLGVTGATTLSSTLGVTGATTLSSTLNAGASTLASATITAAATIGTTLGVTGATTLSSTLGVTGNATVGGTLGVTGAATLSSTLGVTGLITSTAGISGGPATHTTGSFSSTLGVTGATTLSSTLGVTGVTSITNSTASSSTTTGALIVSGGAGIAGNVYVGSTLYVAGNLSVSGTTTTTNSQSLTVTTPQLFLASDNAANTTDVGLLGGYTVASVLKKTGLVKQASSGEWRLFSNTTASPGTTYDFTGAVYDTLRLGTAIVTDTTASSSTTTGALRVSGGAGIAGAAYVGGVLNVAGATTLSAALTYGGVTLSNAVTGTGNMVLSASPTFTGTNTVANMSIGGTLGVTGTSTFTGLITASGGLSGATSGTHTGANVGNSDTASKWLTARTLSLTGDATGSMSVDGSAAASAALTLATVNANVGAFGSSTLVPVITVNAKGLVTGVTTSSISGALTFTGDVTGTGTTGGSTGLTLAASGVTAGSYTNSSITVDAKGRVTSASSGSAGAASSSSNTANTVVLRDGSGNFSAGTITAGAFQVSSDERLKSNITTSSYGLKEILSLNSVQYDKDGKHEIGLIAQQVEPVMPEFVSNGEDGYKSLNYSTMVSVLIKAVQELSAEVESLKKQLG